MTSVALSLSRNAVMLLQKATEEEPVSYKT